MLRITVFGLFLIVPFLGQAQEMDSVQIKTTNVRGNVYLLEGRGGNIGVLDGKDGAVIIDDQFAPLTDKIKTAVTGISGNEIRFVINTHWHGDHVGGNENLAKDGNTIIAHENVRMRLSTEQYNAFRDRTTPPSPEGAWPIITFSESINLHLNNENIQVVHKYKGHTDGDAIIKFEKANVIHAGDSYVTYGFPYIDVSAGGSMAGLIDNARLIVEMCDDNTIVIPGHGPLSKKEDVIWFQNRLESIQEALSVGIAAGKSADDLVNDEALKDFADWDGGFIKSRDFIHIVYEELAANN